MEQEKIAMLAVSLAGHDKGKLYVVLSQNGEMLCLADGTIRRLGSPKQKKMKHVQLIRHMPNEIKDEIFHISKDEDIRRVLKMYRTFQTGDTSN